MKFSTVAQYFDTIEAESSRLAMTKILAELLKQARPNEAAIMCHLSIGQLNPPHIGTQFNIAEEMMVPIVARCLKEEEVSIKQAAKKIGDLGLVIAEGRWRTQEDLTITQVHNRLHAIEQISGTGSQDQKADQLYALLKDLDRISAKYIVRIILGKLRLGFSDMTLVDALSWMEAGDKSLRGEIENAYNACADIGAIAQLLKEEGIEAIRKVRILIGTPIRPASAERLPTAKAVFEKLGTCVAQPKLDGFRLQVHVDKRTSRTKIHFFSRHLTDMSAMFPDLVKAVEILPVTTIIFEGEAIVYDKNTQSFLPFQETVKRKRKHGIQEAAQELPLQLFIFDVLYLNGTSLINEGHEERRKQLLAIMKKVKDPVLQVIGEQEVTNANQLKEYFLHVVGSGLEGLVVKRPSAIYQAGKRNANWIKLKREEGGLLEDTVDCVILGYYAGEGKRASFGIGAFLVGVLNEKEQTFQTIAKIGTGLKDADWKELKKKCDALATKTKPKEVECAKELYPDVWTHPEIVVEILADEITLSPLHSAARTDENPGYALRFPRFIKYRTDKGPQEATTVKEVQQLFKDQVSR